MAKTKTKKGRKTDFVVRVTASYEANALVKAVDAIEAERTARAMMENGSIDPVGLTGTMTIGGVSYYASTIGKVVNRR